MRRRRALWVLAGVTTYAAIRRLLAGSSSSPLAPAPPSPAVVPPPAPVPPPAVVIPPAVAPPPAPVPEPAPVPGPAPAPEPQSAPAPAPPPALEPRLAPTPLSAPEAPSTPAPAPPPAPEPPPRRVRLAASRRDAVMLLAVIAISATVGWLLERGSSSPHKTSTAAGLNANSASSGGHQPAAARHRTRHALPHGWAYIAVPRRRIAQLTVYRSPRGGHVRLVLPRRSAIGVPLTLLVHQVTKNWVQTYLPVRPDRVTGWIKRRELNLKTTSYELHAELGHHRLLLLVADHVVRTFSVGVGKSVTPTPSGRYFITELLKQPDPAGAYGPYAFGLSAFSGVLTHFGRGGNGQIGIHGTDQPQLLGSDVSHGCIRMRNSDVLWLVHRLPLGTPVVIDRT